MSLHPQTDRAHRVTGDGTAPSRRHQGDGRRRPGIRQSATSLRHRRLRTMLVQVFFILAGVGLGRVAIGVFRKLQASAFTSIQLASTLSAIARRGTQVVNDIYPGRVPETPAAPGRHMVGGVRWPARAATLQGIDVPALVDCATRADVVIELCVQPGQVILDEVIATAGPSSHVRRRVDRLLTDLTAIAPAECTRPLQARIQRPSPDPTARQNRAER